jgi:hypothetical protein
MAGAAAFPMLSLGVEDPTAVRLPSEIKTYLDPATGRRIRQFTSAKANSYPLYYFSPSITLDGHYIVFHSERSSWVELYRMDLNTGEIVQLTDGRSRDSGWAIWCEWHLRGIYNHLSALNQARREVYYFQDEEIRCTQLDTLANRLVGRIPGRVSIGQSSFSPDGRHFAFIHADRPNYIKVMQDEEAVRNMRLVGHASDPSGEKLDWRNRIPATIGLIDTETGHYSDIIQLDFHVHHVIFADNKRVIVNHIQNGNGMWIIGIDGTGRRTMRPPDAHGSIVHQVVTKAGIFYEAVGDKANSGAHNWLGRYDLGTDTFEEVPLPEIDGYMHTGLDPEGKFLFFEEHGKTHHLFSLHFPHDPARRRVQMLRSMELYPAPGGQRYHAHPFLSPDRQWIFHTEPIDGYSQVCALDVRDLVDLDEYWDRRS